MNVKRCTAFRKNFVEKNQPLTLFFIKYNKNLQIFVIDTLAINSGYYHVLVVLCAPLTPFGNTGMMLCVLHVTTIKTLSINMLFATLCSLSC